MRASLLSLSKDKVMAGYNRALLAGRDKVHLPRASRASVARGTIQQNRMEVTCYIMFRVTSC